MTQRERLGKYEIIEVLGKGAMGVVFRGFDPGIDRTVAIKTVRKELIEDDGRAGMALARFRNEARAAGRLSHPGIVAVYDYGESEELTYIAMEFVHGSSLREYFNRGTRFGEPDIVSIMAQLLEALQHAHDAGVWHRDIKPGNLIIMSNGRLKVADFGIARIEASQLTQTGVVMGSPGYMAPEQYSGGAIDWRADLFAAGVVMHQLLTGERPFTGTTEQLAYKICHVEPPLPSAMAAGRGWERYDAIIARALAKKPEDRYESATAFRDAILAAYSAPANAAVSEETLIVESTAAAAVFEPSNPSARTGERSPLPGMPSASLAPPPRPLEASSRTAQRATQEFPSAPREADTPAARKKAAVSWPVVAGIAVAVVIGAAIGGWLVARNADIAVAPAVQEAESVSAAATPSSGAAPLPAVEEPATPAVAVAPPATPEARPSPAPAPTAAERSASDAQKPPNAPEAPKRAAVKPPRPKPVRVARAESPVSETKTSAPEPPARTRGTTVARAAPPPAPTSSASLPGAPAPAPKPVQRRSVPAPAASAPEPVAAAEPKPPPAPSIWQDQGITMKVASRIQFNRRLWTYGIQVETVAGIVTLKGTVETRAEYAEAEKLAAGVSGVLGVKNEIKITP